MSLTYGFYNSLNHDRKYDARQISRLFDGLITDGVYRSIGSVFAVSVNSGMILNVAEGRAWFDHTWTLNDTVMTVTLPEAHSVYTKIVAIIIRVDKTIPLFARKELPVRNPKSQLWIKLQICRSILWLM